MTPIAQTVPEYLTSDEEELVGTARFVGMAGAMTAVGADPSAVKLNPAGLGVYRRSQFSFTADGAFRQFSPETERYGYLYNRWHCSQVSYVFAVGDPNTLSGAVFNNLMISYARRADYLRSLTIYDPANTRCIELAESGWRHDVDLHYAMNVSNRFYWGLGMTLEFLRLDQKIAYHDLSYHRKLTDNDYANGVGWGAAFGFIYRPVKAFRFAASVESPILGGYNHSYFYWDDTDSSNFTSITTRTRDQLRTPVKATAGMAFQCADVAIISLQYDMTYHDYWRDIVDPGGKGFNHTGRVGIDVLAGPVQINAGYAYSARYSRQHASAGLGYAGRYIRLNAAYTCCWQKGLLYWRDQDTGYYQGNFGVAKQIEHKIILTFQWNS